MFASAAKSRDLCPVCSRGFQLRRDPPLHLLCSACGKPSHTRCIPKQKRGERTFVCVKCKPADPPISAPRVSSGLTPCPPQPSPAPSPSPSPSMPPSYRSPSVGSQFPLKFTTAGPGAAARRERERQRLNCEESLLIEPSDTFSSFDNRMNSLGFKRSPSQPNTIGDGACGVRALCDQLNISSEAMFGPDDHELARKYTASQARLLVKSKVLEEEFFEPDVNQWCTRMSRNSEFIDNIFLLVFAYVQDRDIVVIPVHRETAPGTYFAGNGDFRWIKGLCFFIFLAMCVCVFVCACNTL